MSEDLAKKSPETDSEKLTLILTTMQALTGRVESAESLRPLLYKVVDDISQIRADIAEIRGDISQLKEGQIEIRADVLKLKEGQTALSVEVRAIRRDVDHRFDLIYDKLVETDRDHCDLHNRLSRLELDQKPPNSQT